MAAGQRSNRISFRNIWTVENKGTLLPRFAAYANWPLRGLFWLSKELFDPDLKLSTAPDARELHELRNYLEHKYLQVHEGWATGAIAATGEFGRSVPSTEIKAKALRVMKIARSALCHLSLAIGREERMRETGRPEGIAMPMLLSTWEDDWKRADL